MFSKSIKIQVIALFFIIKKNKIREESPTVINVDCSIDDPSNYQVVFVNVFIIKNERKKTFVCLNLLTEALASQVSMTPSGIQRNISEPA